MNSVGAKYKPYIKEEYEASVPSLVESLGVKNIFEVPKLESIVLHMRFGRYLSDKPKQRYGRELLATIGGAVPCDIVARKSVSQFKVRAGMLCGTKITLRGNEMYEFLARLKIALARMRNFNGFDDKSFDRMGNFSFGIEEHVVFVEVENKNEEGRYGFDITLTWTGGCREDHALNKKKGIALMTALGLPFIRK